MLSRLHHRMAAQKHFAGAYSRLVTPAVARLSRALSTVTCSPTSAWRPCSIREATLSGPFQLALGGTIHNLRVKVEVRVGQ